MTSGRLQILCAEPENYSDRGLEAARALGDVTAIPMNQEAFEREAPHFDVWMVRLRLRVHEALVGSAPGLRAVVSPTTGLNHIAMETLETRGVPVFHLRGETAFLQTITSTAEHTFSLLLGLVRKVAPAYQAVREGRWEQRSFRGRELRGKTLGVLGYGRLGRWVARYGQAFQMRIVAYDPAVSEAEPFVTLCATMDELLETSDVVSVHVPLRSDTRSLLDRRALGLLRPGAVLVNTSRGELVDEAAVIELLEAGHLGGYATDVLSDEASIPTRPHPLVTYARSHDNLLITPHIGGAAVEAIEQTDLFVLSKLSRWWEQQQTA